MFTSVGDGQISIHAPRTGSDKSGFDGCCKRCPFQSTLPARGATRVLYTVTPSGSFQSTLPARGATQLSFRAAPQISFQSTLPARGATHTQEWACPRRYFNPRSPHGERPIPSRSFSAFCVFQSTLPARGATWVVYPAAAAWRISIHAPRTGSDIAPCAVEDESNAISIHAPRTGSDILVYKIWFIIYDFNPRSPHGERRPAHRPTTTALEDFNPRSPHGERPN